MEPPDPKEDKLRLASELSGEEGHLEASAWVREFLIASRGAGAGGDSALLGTPPRAGRQAVSKTSSPQSRPGSSPAGQPTLSLPPPVQIDRDVDDNYTEYSGDKTGTTSPSAQQSRPIPNPNPNSGAGAGSSVTVISQQQLQKVERVLLNLCFNASVEAFAAGHLKECVVLLNVQDVGGWFVKFRAYGAIVNNRDLVNQECVDVDATLSCSTGGFWTIVNGGIQVQDALRSQLVRVSGSHEAVEILWQNLISGGSVSAASAHGAAVAGARARTRTDSNANEVVAALKSVESKSKQASLPLKSGWLLKKRELWNGWRCRYFVLYPGKLAYYTDQHDTQPKAVISLAGAEVYAPKRCTISGNSDHWYFM